MSKIERKGEKEGEQSQPPVGTDNHSLIGCIQSGMEKRYADSHIESLKMSGVSWRGGVNPAVTSLHLRV